MNHDVRAMLEGMYAQIYRELKDPEQSWDRFIEYIAAENSLHLAEQMPGFLGWLFGNDRLKKGLPETYDMRLHISDYYDHLGDMYEERLRSKQLTNCLNLRLTPVDEVDRIARESIPQTDNDMAILAPVVATGRLLMAARKRAPNAHLFGADPDLRTVRIALTNLAVYDIDGYLLHADAMKHDVDISSAAGQYNWKFANRWDSCIQELKPRTRPPAPPAFSSLN